MKKEKSYTPRFFLPVLECRRKVDGKERGGPPRPSMRGNGVSETKADDDNTQRRGGSSSNNADVADEGRS